MLPVRLMTPEVENTEWRRPFLIKQKRGVIITVLLSTVSVIGWFLWSDVKPRSNETWIQRLHVSEPCEGTFWVDRWCQGHLFPSPDFVDESLFLRLFLGLQGNKGRPIRVIGPHISQESFDFSPECLMEFVAIETIPDSPPVSIQLRWLDSPAGSEQTAIRRIEGPQELSVQVEFVNNGDSELLLKPQDLLLTPFVRHPPEAHPTESRYYCLEYGYTIRRKRGKLRYWSAMENLMAKAPHSPNNSPFTSPIRLKPGEKVTWNVAISNWPPNEFEILARYHPYEAPSTGGAFVYSNRLFLDVLTDVPYQEDLIEVRLQFHEGQQTQPTHGIPLEIVYRNKSEKDLQIKFDKGTKDDLDLSDMLFCYGNDGQLLPLTEKVSGPMAIPLPAGKTATLAVSVPVETVVARCVFLDPRLSRPLRNPADYHRFVWHWSQHWIAPSLKRSLEERDGRK